MPVITMELLPGGTLKDVVESRGPLVPQHAVDAVLQAIAGLDAAHRAGILCADHPSRVVEVGQPWGVVREWLPPLAEEMEAGLADGTLTRTQQQVLRPWYPASPASR